MLRQELEGLDRLKGNYRVEEVNFKAEKRREEANFEKEKEEEVVRLTEEEWVEELASMTTREQREMERFLGERGDIRIMENPGDLDGLDGLDELDDLDDIDIRVMENPGCSSKRSWRFDVEGVGTLFLPLRLVRKSVFAPGNWFFEAQLS